VSVSSERGENAFWILKKVFLIFVRDGPPWRKNGRNAPPGFSPHQRTFEISLLQIETTHNLVLTTLLQSCNLRDIIPLRWEISIESKNRLLPSPMRHKSKMQKG
jgi:hypothetical protein